MGNSSVTQYRKTYEEYREELGTEIRRTAEGFVRIGYLLKVARDTDILRESGYATVAEFAQKEYHIDKTQVSRFIQINDRFSEGGYSDRLEEQYRGFGFAKLTIMLKLPDGINGELTPSYSKTEIQALREELDEEKKVTDIEVILEGEREETRKMESILDKTIWQMGKDFPGLYLDISRGARQQGWTLDMVKALMAPDGEKIYSVRISGVGRMMLVLKDTEDTVSLVSLRTSEKQTFLWADVLLCWQQVFPDPEADAEKQWSGTYGEEFPKKAEVAPVQPQESRKKQSRKESRVAKAPEKKKEQQNPVKTEADSPGEQIPGQTSIGNDFPQYLPQSMEKTEETVQEEPETGGQEPPEPEGMPAADMENDTDTAETVPYGTPEEQMAGCLEELERKMDEINILTSSWPELDSWAVPPREIRNAYHSAVDMAAVLERMWMLAEQEGGHGKEHHAQ